MALKRVVQAILGRAVLRILLATAVLIAGFAPVGVPILSDANWLRAAEQITPVDAAPPVQPFVYRWNSAAAGSAAIERSDDGGKTWHRVADIAEAILDLQAVPGDEQVVVGLGTRTVWLSRDGGASWARAAELPSRALSLALTHRESGLMLVGTESLGLLVSRDMGDSWHVTEDGVLAAGGTAPTAVTALAATRDNPSVIYAATAIWLGTSRARLSPVGIFASVDGAQSWLPVERASLGALPVMRLQPVDGERLAVRADEGAGFRLITPAMSAELLQLLNATDARTRAAAARYAGLLGDPAAIPALLLRLRDPDLLAGELAAEAIGRIGDRQAVPDLMTALSSRDGLVRGRAAVALGMLKAEEAVPALAAMLSTETAPALRQAADALASIGTSEALDALVAALDGDALNARVHAAKGGLELAGPRSVDPLATALTAGSAHLRTNAAAMLGWLRAASATDALAGRLVDPEPSVAEEAAWALGEVGTPEARDRLEAAIRAERRPQVTDAMTAALARIEATSPQYGAAEAGALRLLLDAAAAVPASRWTLLVIALMAAATLLAMGPRAARRPSIRGS